MSTPVRLGAALERLGTHAARADWIRVLGAREFAAWGKALRPTGRTSSAYACPDGRPECALLLTDTGTGAWNARCSEYPAMCASSLATANEVAEVCLDAGALLRVVADVLGLASAAASGDLSAVCLLGREATESGPARTWFLLPVPDEAALLSWLSSDRAIPADRTQLIVPTPRLAERVLRASGSRVGEVLALEDLVGVHDGMLVGRQGVDLAPVHRTPEQEYRVLAGGGARVPPGGDTLATRLLAEGHPALVVVDVTTADLKVLQPGGEGPALPQRRGIPAAAREVVRREGRWVDVQDLIDELEVTESTAREYLRRLRTQSRKPGSLLWGIVEVDGRGEDLRARWAKTSSRPHLVVRPR